MSFEGKYKTKIKVMNREFMLEAIKMMIKDLELEVCSDTEFKLENMHGGKIRVKGLCFRVPGAAHPVDLFLNKKDVLEMQCGSYDKNKYEKYIGRLEKQFYPAVVLSHQTNAKVEYNKNTNELELLITR